MDSAAAALERPLKIKYTRDVLKGKQLSYRQISASDKDDWMRAAELVIRLIFQSASSRFSE